MRLHVSVMLILALALTLTSYSIAGSVNAHAGAQPQTANAPNAPASIAPTVRPPTIRRLLLLLLKFSDDSNGPLPPSYYSDLITPISPPNGSILPATVNEFYTASSWGQLEWQADVGGASGVPAAGWLTLPHPHDYYCPGAANVTCAHLDRIAIDGTQAGVAAGIYFPQYDYISFILSNDLGCCAYAGPTALLTLNGVSRTYNATWMPPESQNAASYVQELGRNLGLPYSGWVYYPRDSPWDAMSMNPVYQPSEVQCGSYLSDNANQTATPIYCEEPGADIIAPYKSLLGWIDPAHEATVWSNSSLTARIDALALPLTDTLKIVKVCVAGYPCDGSAARYFTIEARFSTDTPTRDRGIPGDGVIIHYYQADRASPTGACFPSSQSQYAPAYPVDSTPGDYNETSCSSNGAPPPDYGLYNAQWTPGETFTNATYGFNVTVLSQSGHSFIVLVNGPTVSTDKTVYARGDTIHYWGTGYTPDTSVNACLSGLNCAITFADGGGAVNDTLHLGSNTTLGPHTFHLNDPSTQVNSTDLQLNVTLKAVTMTLSFQVVGGGTQYAGPLFTYVHNQTVDPFALSTAPHSIPVDYGTNWTVTPNPLSGSNGGERWASNQTLAGDTSNATIVFTFYHQYLVLLSYSVAGGGSGYSAPVFNCTRFGSPSIINLTETPTLYWLDGGAWSVTNPLTGSNSSERWDTVSSNSTLNSSGSLNFVYQHEYYLTMAAQPFFGGTISPSSEWVNANDDVNITAVPEAHSQFSTWNGTGAGSYSGSTSNTTITVNAPINETAQFLVQVTMTVNYRIADGGSPTAPTFSYVHLGVPETYSLTTTPVQISADYGTEWSVTPNPLTGSSKSERWTSNQTLTDTVLSDNQTVAFTFYHQYLQTLSYAVIGGGSPVPPSITMQWNGTAALTLLPAGYWVENSTRWTVPASLGGSTGAEQWTATQPTNGTFTSPQTLEFDYQHQYYLTMLTHSEQPLTGGDATPPSGWNDAGSNVTITAVANSTSAFASWTGIGAGSYTGTDNPANVTVGGAVSEVADFAYSGEVNVTITSTPPGDGYLSVDGVLVTTPWTSVWNIGEPHSVAASAPSSCGSGCESAFYSWSDGGPQNHTVAAPAVPYMALALTFTNQYRLILQASPSSGGTATSLSANFVSTCGDGCYWYNDLTPIYISASPTPTYLFAGWVGNGYSGGANPASFVLHSPVNETAQFSRNVQPLILNLEAELQQYAINRSITKLSLEQSLYHKVSVTATLVQFYLNNPHSPQARSRIQYAKIILNAFISQVMAAQRGGLITSQAAAKLVADANLIMSNSPFT